jgi:type IV fimbrial biogenesis protein FimT
MKMNKNSKKHQAGARGKSGGLSLIEAMIVLFILAISVAVAIPLMVGTFGRANSEVYLDRVKATLELGRITAMSEFVSVFLCPSTDGATCNTGY